MRNRESNFSCTHDSKGLESFLLSPFSWDVQMISGEWGPGLGTGELTMATSELLLGSLMIDC